MQNKAKRRFFILCIIPELLEYRNLFIPKIP